MDFRYALLTFSPKLFSLWKSNKLAQCTSFSQQPWKNCCIAVFIHRSHKKMQEEIISCMNDKIIEDLLWSHFEIENFDNKSDTIIFLHLFDVYVVCRWLNSQLTYSCSVLLAGIFIFVQSNKNENIHVHFISQALGKNPLKDL